MGMYGCSPIHARTLTSDPRLADFYEKVSQEEQVLAATWVADTLLGELNYRDMGISAVSPEQFVELLSLIRTGEITDKSGIEVLRVILDQTKDGGKCESPKEVVDRLGLRVFVSKTLTGRYDIEDPIIVAAKEAILENPQAADDYRNGKNEALNYLIGQVMKKTRGCAKPNDVNRILTNLLTRGG